MQSKDRIHKLVKTYSILIIGIIIGIVSRKLTNNFERDYEIGAWEVAFRPGDQCQKKIIDLIDRAKSTILMEAYSFTSEDICAALIRAKERGVSVRVIIDKTYYDKKIHRLLEAKNVEVLFDTRVGIMHNKVIIVDSRFVETGSYNFSVNAENKNRENIIILDSPTIAAEHTKNWNNILPYCSKIIARAPIGKNN